MTPDLYLYLYLPSKCDNIKYNYLCWFLQPVLSEQDLQFIANHTAVSREQVDMQYENFLKDHPDGKITKKDFRKMMKDCYPPINIDKLESHIFRMYDTNGDGYIDFREFMIVLYVMSEGSPEENLRQMFRIFDINNDKSVDLEELGRIVHGLFKLFKHEDNPENLTEANIALKAFKEMDTNTDGKVTEDEFVRACLGQETISKILALKVIEIFI